MKEKTIDGAFKSTAGGRIKRESEIVRISPSASFTTNRMSTVCKSLSQLMNLKKEESSVAVQHSHQKEVQTKELQLKKNLLLGNQPTMLSKNRVRRLIKKRRWQNCRGPNNKKDCCPLSRHAKGRTDHT